MKYLIFLMTVCFNLTLQARDIVDDYGRHVNIPEHIQKIYAASPPLTMGLVAFDPVVVSALNFPFNQMQKPYVGSAASKPVVGGFFGQGYTPNYEKIATVKPDVILLWGGMPNVESIINKLSALNIPVILVRNNTMEDLITQFDLYGKLTQNKQRADTLIAYTKETLNLIKSLQKEISQRKPIRYYFAEGVDGLMTECKGSFHLEPFNYTHTQNAIECNMSSNFGMEKVSLETIFLADPDVIIAMEKSFVDLAHHNPKWNRLRAIRTKQIYAVPNLPFNYISRPPSFMRLLGIRWLIHIFYPDLITSIESEQKRFESLFFPTYTTTKESK